MTLMKNYEIVSEAPYWSKIVNKKLIFISALCLLAFTKSASAVPMLTVTADHLGSGLIQYTLTGVNDLGGAVAVQITATTPHTINQIPTFFFPDAAPDGGADLLLGQVDLAQMFDAAYAGAGGQAADSWYDDTVLNVSSPPFHTIVADAAVGGNVGSNQFSYSRGSALGSNIASFRIGQMVILDPAAIGLTLGPLPVNTIGGLAEMDIIDLFNVGPFLLPGLSIIAAGGITFSITGSFFVTPEPGTALLGLLACIGCGCRRRRRKL